MQYKEESSFGDCGWNLRNFEGSKNFNLFSLYFTYSPSFVIKLCVVLFFFILKIEDLLMLEI